MTNNRRHKKYQLETYDYSTTCNFERCKDDYLVSCLKCGNKGHPDLYLDSSEINQVTQQIKANLVVKHGHFALKKGTKIPELDVGRNVWCKVDDKMIPLTDVTISYSYRGRKLPYWARKRFDGEGAS